MLPLLRCPFVDFFGSLASRGFPSCLSLSSEGWDDFGRSRDAFLCFPRFFLPFRSTWSSGRGGGVSGRMFGARELASVSSVHSWTGDTGVALVLRTPATFYVRLALPPHLCTFDEVMGWESDSECRLGYVLGYLSRLISAHSARW